MNLSKFNNITYGDNTITNIVKCNNYYYIDFQKEIVFILVFIKIIIYLLFFINNPKIIKFKLWVIDTLYFIDFVLVFGLLFSFYH